MDNKKRKLSLEKNDDQKECEEIEASALKQKLVHMEAELKQRNAEKEYLVQRVTSLEQHLAKKEAQLNLRNAEKEDLVQRVTSLEHDLAKKEASLAKKEAQLNLNNAEKEDLVQQVTSLEQDLEEKQGYLNLYSLYLDSDGSSVCSGVSVSDDDMEPVEESSETVLSESSNFDYLALKEEGNALYSVGDFMGAVQKYSKCLEFCTDNSTDRSTLLKNRAAAYLNLQEYQKVVEDTTAALEITPSDIKALYRRCQAYEQLGKYNEAFEDARAVNRLNPKNSAIQPFLRRLQETVNELNDDALDINSFPNEIILNIFGYLEQNQLGQIARVCKRWNVLTKSPVLWKRVNVKLSPCYRYEYNVAEAFINILPSCVTSISLNLKENGLLDFEKLCVKLQKKCPHLEELKLINSEILVNLSSVIGVCTQLLQDVKNLIFHYSKFCCFRSTDGCFDISKIETLELLYCFFDCSDRPPFSKMPNLKQLHLYGTNVDDSWFKYGNTFLNQLNVLNLGFSKIVSRIFSTIQNRGHNLKELYLCSTVLQDHDLKFNHSAFPHLKTICLHNPYMTCEGVVSIIQSCPSVENVYVKKDVAESFAVHPFVVANRCKAGIVKAIDWNHNHNVNYSHT